MREVLTAWAVSAAVLVLAAGVIGHEVGGSPFAVLIDRRGRYSLSQLQIVVWTLVVVSLLSGLMWGRLLTGSPDPLDIRIPDELLALLGVNVVSTVSAAAIKAGKDRYHPAKVAAGSAPRFAQVFMPEEGAGADSGIDAAKFQSFWVSVLLVVGYVALAAATIGRAASVDQLTALPAMSGTLVTLLGLSHAGYLAGKLPLAAGEPEGSTVASTQTEAREAKEAKAAAAPATTRARSDRAKGSAQPAG